MNVEGRGRWDSDVTLVQLLQSVVWEAVVRLVLVAVFVCMNRFVRPVQLPVSASAMRARYARPRRDSIIPPWLMVIIGLVIPFLTFTLPSVYYQNYEATLNAVLGWSLAIVVNALITEVLKLSVGSPRPDYLYRCFPDGEVMLTEQQCRGRLKDVLEGRKSFPSGHSSFAFSSLGFLSLWLWAWRGECAVISGVPLAAASTVALSRLLDNHHHVRDVVAGAVLGMLVAYWCFKRYHNQTHNTQNSSSVYYRTI